MTPLCPACRLPLLPASENAETARCPCGWSGYLDSLAPEEKPVRKIKIPPSMEDAYRTANLVLIVLKDSYPSSWPEMSAEDVLDQIKRTIDLLSAVRKDANP
jgi:hypothetical protein